MAVKDMDKMECKNMACILENSFNWECLPIRFRIRHQVKTRWGRTGIEFGEWIPTTWPGMLVGFLLDPKNHCLEMCDRNLCIDLLLTFDVGNTGQRLPPTVITQRAAALQQAEPNLTIRVDRMCRNKRQVLTVQQSLSSVVGQSLCGDKAQSLKVYQRFHRWITVLFEGGELERAVDTTWPL